MDQLSFFILDELDIYKFAECVALYILHQRDMYFEQNSGLVLF